MAYTVTVLVTLSIITSSNGVTNAVVINTTETQTTSIALVNITASTTVDSVITSSTTAETAEAESTKMNTTTTTRGRTSASTGATTQLSTATSRTSTDLTPTIEWITTNPTTKTKPKHDDTFLTKEMITGLAAGLAFFVGIICCFGVMWCICCGPLCKPDNKVGPQFTPTPKILREI